MMRPLFCCRNRMAACLTSVNVPLRWTAITSSHSSSVMLKIIRSRRIPAAVTTMSSPPNSSMACWTRPSPVAISVTDRVLATASPPAARIAAAVSSAGPVDSPLPSTAPPMSLTTTFAPISPSCSATALPIPLPAPVTIATRPSSRSAISRSFLIDRSLKRCGLPLRNYFKTRLHARASEWVSAAPHPSPAGRGFFYGRGCVRGFLGSARHSAS